MYSNRMKYDSDEDYYFLMSLLPYLRDIPKRRKLATRIVMQKIVLQENSSQTLECPKSSDSTCSSNYGSALTPNVNRRSPNYKIPQNEIKKEVFTHEMSSLPMDSQTDEPNTQCQHFLEENLKTEHDPSKLYGTTPLEDSTLRSNGTVVSEPESHGNLGMKNGKLIARAASFIHEGHHSDSGNHDILPTHLVDALHASVNHEKYPRMNQILTSENSVNKMYKCDMCNVNFTEIKSLKRHLFQHLKRRFKCKICSAFYKSEKPFIKHKKTHA